MTTSDNPPTPPDPSECCGNGCEPCVWDIYREELRKWQEKQESTERLLCLEDLKIRGFDNN